MDRARIGTLAEQTAVDYLRSKGYRILDCNYRKPWGEIDIITQIGPTVVFIEVKANLKDIVGFEPELRANGAKMHKVLRTAQLYLQHQYPDEEKEWQIDIISVIFNTSTKTARIKHFKNITM